MTELDPATQAAMEGKRALLLVGQYVHVHDAMRDAWNDICADSGHRPRDLYRQGNKTFFEPSTWAELTGQIVAVALVKAGFQNEKG